MIIEAKVEIEGTRAAAWAAITNIDRAAEIISGIQELEIVERPARGLVGFKWRETRLLFDKPATAEKWITEAVDHEFYRTRTEDGGFVFVTTRRLSGGDGRLTLTESHESRPQTLKARLVSIPMRLFFMGVIRKAVQRDLDDIKAAVERPAGA